MTKAANTPIRTILIFSLFWGLVFSCRPPGEYVPRKPDFKDPYCWYTRENDTTGTGGDIFYVVSTWVNDWKTEQGDTCFYADIYNPVHRERVDRENSRIAAYMGEGNNFYSPYYRHMAGTTWASQDEKLIFRRERLSMQDVKDAFDVFQASRDHSRPFVLAGFSQGGLAVVELLKYMSDEDYDHLAAAYILGYKVTPADTAATRHIRPAQGAGDTGVTICYNSVQDVKYIKPFVAAPNVMSINPVNWRTDATPATLHDTVTVTLNPEHHVLVVTGYSASEYKPILKGLLNTGDIHGAEPWLYQDCLKENINLRIRNWREEHQNR